MDTMHDIHTQADNTYLSVLVTRVEFQGKLKRTKHHFTDV